ncbi:hypothetical protein HMP0721_0187 [Pseudoramibacter alactolyticus ATCC 23263]|uniref:Uncharacterized protein n=1 Tax=Pseudoramibacter alactolyticus ATCC 23263 TaxID=887929 RepID=E6MDV4_9FIRM|nr:hypothetical protein HMP0721_0187 [Pseudoramibacter alactolyticus ATCC 23263]
MCVFRKFEEKLTRGRIAKTAPKQPHPAADFRGAWQNGSIRRRRVIVSDKKISFSAEGDKLFQSAVTMKMRLKI